MKKVSFSVLFLSLTLFLSGCRNAQYLFPARREVTELDLIKIFGSDYIKDSEEFRLSVLLSSDDPTSQSGGASPDKAKASEEKESSKKVLSETGKSNLDNYSLMDLHTDKILDNGHVDYILIGEDSAKNGISAALDAFIRDTSMRINIRVYIAKDCTAEEMLNSSLSEEYFLPKKLDTFKTQLVLDSSAHEVEIKDIMQSCINEKNAFLVPALEIVEEQGKKETIELAGYAVFKNSKLVGYIDVDDSKYAAIFVNKTRAYRMTVDDEKGNTVDLNVVYSNMKFIPHIDENDNLTGLTIRLKTRSHISEMHAPHENSSSEFISKLAEAQSIRLEQKMSKVTDIAQSLKADFAGLERYLKAYYPKCWKKNKDNWQEIFGSLPVYFDVYSLPQHGYELTDFISSEVRISNESGGEN